MKFTLAAAAVAVVLAAEKKGDDKKKTEEPKATCLDGIKMSAYTDDKCTKPLKKEDKPQVKEINEAEAKVLNSACNELDAKDKAQFPASTKFVSMNTVCDAKSMNFKMYEEAKCAGDATAVAIKWGDCKEVKTKDKDGKEKSYYYTLTGATSLQATAAIALAYVASQF